MTPKEKYIICGGDVVPVYELSNGDLTIAADVFKASDYIVYTNRFDAMYAKLIKDLQKGKPLENYRSSKYYKQYIERLKKENPEFAI
jgi:hypothetical protein